MKEVETYSRFLPINMATWKYHLDWILFIILYFLDVFYSLLFLDLLADIMAPPKKVAGVCEMFLSLEEFILYF